MALNDHEWIVTKIQEHDPTNVLFAATATLTCGHSIVFDKSTGNWAAGKPHFCDACAFDYQEVVRVTPFPDGVRLTLACGHEHPIDYPFFLRPMTCFVLLNTWVNCPMCSTEPELYPAL